MTYDSREQSTYSGAPYELYKFDSGTMGWRLTTADAVKTFGNEDYTPEAITRSATQQSKETQGGTVQVTLPRDHPITAMFVSYIPPAPLWLTIYRAHEGEPEAETRVIFIGRVTLDTKGEGSVLTCSPEQEYLKRMIPTMNYQRPCNHMLYDSGCKVQKLLYSATGQLTAFTADSVSAAAFALLPDGYFTHGYIERGQDRRFVIDHTGDTLTLMVGLSGLELGDEVLAYAGCDRSYDTCGSKFSNTANFYGFEWIPTKNPFGPGGIK